MEKDQITQPRISLRKLNWRWVGIGLCMFIVYHLLPLHILRYGLSPLALLQGWPLAIWSFGGVAIVGLMIGYLSRGYTILEPGVSGTAYVVVVFLVSRVATEILPHKATEDFNFLIVILGAVFVLGVGGGLIGELFQAKSKV